VKIFFASLLVLVCLAAGAPTAWASGTEKVLFDFEKDTGGWWTFQSGATLKLTNDSASGAKGSAGSLMVSYQWQPGSSSYLGIGVEPKWSMGGDKWSSYAQGQLEMSLKSDVPVSVRIELRDSSKQAFAYTLIDVPSIWRNYKIPLSLFTNGGKSIDLTADDVAQLVLIPNKADESPHSLWVDQIALSTTADSTVETYVDEGKLPAQPAPITHLVPFPFKRTGHPLDYTGVNISGGDFGGPAPGRTLVYGKDFTYPTDRELTYFADRGVNIIRFPFHWEVLQPVLNGPLDPTELARFKAVVQTATDKGLVVLLDPHNYERYYGKLIGGPNVSDAAFADFWGALAGNFKDNPRVWFGLINEPYGAPVSQWLASAQAAVTAIRQSGSKNMILVPGEGYTGAHSWLDTGSDAMTQLKDPANNYQFEVHQYLDSDDSGSHPDAVSATIGVERLRTFTNWCRKSHKKAFLGEFGTAAGEANHTAIDNMLNYMEANRDVWTGFTWWAAGAWWGGYMYTVEPKSAAQDRPQFFYLTPHLHGI
jgi:endoglucanase